MLGVTPPGAALAPPPPPPLPSNPQGGDRRGTGRGAAGRRPLAAGGSPASAPRAEAHARSPRGAGGAGRGGGLLVVASPQGPPRRAGVGTGGPAGCAPALPGRRGWLGRSAPRPAVCRAQTRPAAARRLRSGAQGSARLAVAAWVASCESPVRNVTERGNGLRRTRGRRPRDLPGSVLISGVPEEVLCALRTDGWSGCP